MRSGFRSLGLAIALLAAGLSQVWAARRSDPDKLPSIKVQDLHYGDVLFHYWADEDSGLETLTRLEAYNHWQRMPHHAVDAQLLAAGLYLQLGMHNQAGERFATLLGDDIPPGVRNKAWFYLGKIWYERGYFDRSEQALNRIQGQLPPQQEAERTHLLVNVLMREQRYDEAIALLESWQGPPDWTAYARFNLGVALVRAGRLAQADPVLTKLGTLQTDSDELLTMRDKANLALGFAYLQADQAAQAPAIEREQVVVLSLHLDLGGGARQQIQRIGQLIEVGDKLLVLQRQFEQALMDRGHDINEQGRRPGREGRPLIAVQGAL